jgi:hypothetical protein
MALYKIFLMRDGEPVEEIERDFAEDLDALEAARALARDHVVEVYSDIRLVTRVKQGDEAPTVTDARSG